LISVTVGSAGAPGACSAPGSLGGAPAAPAWVAPTARRRSRSAHV